MWEHLQQLAEDWTCRFVLGSGSLIKFWENPRIFGENKTAAIPSMVPEQLRDLSGDFEHGRVRYHTRCEPLTLASLCNWIQEFSGPRLVIMNTVQSAAVVARELRQRSVITKHLSTALAPIHRKKILKDIETLLLEKPDLDWVLVATSCIEAGVELSFALAFRERSRATSIVQVGGRVNRHGERTEGGVVWDFIVNDPCLPPHPDFRHSRDVVEDLFRKNMWGGDLTTLMTYALEQEFKRSSKEANIKELSDSEKAGSYPTVGKLTRLITADTRIVVTDQQLIANLRRRIPVDRRDLFNNSVQLWATKIQALALNPIAHELELYAWEYTYDPEFLGIMEGVLEHADIARAGCAVV
jgi:CRISPR-associated endonuclease/helicase Cas3